jgi:hypothetical protein
MSIQQNPFATSRASGQANFWRPELGFPVNVFLHDLIVKERETWEIFCTGP